MEKKLLIVGIGKQTATEKPLIDHLLKKLPEDLKKDVVEATDLNESQALQIFYEKIGESQKKQRATLLIYAGSNLQILKNMPCDHINLTKLIEGLKASAEGEVSLNFIKEAATGAILRVLGTRNNREAIEKIRYSIYSYSDYVHFTEYPEHESNLLIERFIEYLNSKKVKDIILVDHESLTVELRKGRLAKFVNSLEENFEGWKLGKITSLRLRKDNRHYLKKK